MVNGATIKITIITDVCIVRPDGALIVTPTANSLNILLLKWVIRKHLLYHILAE